MDMHPDNFSILTPEQREIAVAICHAVDGCEATNVIHAMISIMAATINQSGNAAEVADVVASALVNTAAAGRLGMLRMHGEALQ
ncbi:MAG: hypothetical protein DI589_25485 [Shinella sp.]|jgi:hypothetical protein|nr:MAG: hypothetical protein DI589_25485 [Shinella sp.]